MRGRFSDFAYVPSDFGGAVAPPDSGVALTPITSGDNSPTHLTFLLNFSDELRRKVPVGKKRHMPLMAELPRKQFIRNVLFG